MTSSKAQNSPGALRAPGQFLKDVAFAASSKSENPPGALRAPGHFLKERRQAALRRPMSPSNVCEECFPRNVSTNQNMPSASINFSINANISNRRKPFPFRRYLRQPENVFLNQNVSNQNQSPANIHVVNENNQKVFLAIRIQKDPSANPKKIIISEHSVSRIPSIP